MQAITAKVGKHNGRPLGVSVFLGAKIVEAIGAQNRDFVTFSVTSEPGKMILTVEEEKNKTATVER